MNAVDVVGTGLPAPGDLLPLTLQVKRLKAFSLLAILDKIFYNVFMWTFQDGLTLRLYLHFNLILNKHFFICFIFFIQFLYSMRLLLTKKKSAVEE